MAYKFFFSFLVLTAFLTSCSSDDTTVEYDLGMDYVPISEGSWIEYKLDSTLYSDFDNSEVTHSYNLRVVFGEQIEDGEGSMLTKVRRYMKPANSSADYELQNVWFTKIENNRLETFEDNLHFIKLLFPTTVDKQWEGNVFIAGEGNDNPTTSTVYYKDWEYFIEDAGFATAINDLEFTDVLLINQHDEVGGPGAIQHLVSKEWYARGVGLVKKRMEMVVENCGSPGCSNKNLPVLERPTKRKGYILNMEVTDFQIQ